MPKLAVLLCALLMGLARPALAQAPSLLQLSARITQDEGLEKHLFSFALPDKPVQWVGLTGTVSLATTLNYFGEALISVNYYAGPNCAAVNGLSFAAYDAPGFPPLTRLASFILKTPRAQVVTQPVAIQVKQGLRVAPCIVVILDGGGAWGPGHEFGYTVTMQSTLDFAYAPIPAGQSPTEIAYGLGGEYGFGSASVPSGSGVATILRVNPQAKSRFLLDALFGSISASAFDGSSGEAVPHGVWGVRVAAFTYPGPLCAAYFPVDTPFQGPLKVFSVPIASAALPAGGAMLRVSSLQGEGEAETQTNFDTPLYPTTLSPGDCLLILHRAGANGVIDLEDQSTVLMRPLDG
jgi:hypothetical protein